MSRWKIFERFHRTGWKGLIGGVYLTGIRIRKGAIVELDGTGRSSGKLVSKGHELVSQKTNME